MSIIVPHIPRDPQQHSRVPYLWRTSCSCGWFALAADRERALMAISSHLDAEEPFPLQHILEDSDGKPDR